MINCFKPDIFSNPIPKWSLGSMKNLGSLFKHLPEDFGKNAVVEYAGGLEINSNNISKLVAYVVIYSNLNAAHFGISH
jgi:hypothetical protein